MAAQSERKTTTAKKKGGSSSSGAQSGSSSGSGAQSSGGSSGGGGSVAASMLRSVVGGAVGADTLVDLIERLGLVDLVLGRVKSRIEDTDLDELLDDVTDYLRRNPEVLVVSLGAVTVATGLLVWLNNRREWDGSERRNATAAQTARARRAAAEDDDDDDEDDD